MPIFRPPTNNVVAYVDVANQFGLAYRLFRFYEPEPRGVNVYKLIDGSFTDAEQSNPDSYTKIYWGGSENVVTRSEAIVLENAGYTVDFLDNDVLKSAVLWLDTDGY